MALIGALVYGLIAQALALYAHWGGNPLSRVPIVDAEAYWEWAGRIAGGEWQGSEPFFSAPLYPYVLGVLRAMGGGLLAVYLLNGLLWLASAALIGRCGWRRYGALEGALATWLFVLAFDPFVAVGRVLAGPLQVFVVVALLERCSALQAQPTRARALGVGVLAGLAALAWPVLLPAIPLLGLWCAWMARPRQLGVWLAATGALLVLPATLHNVTACGEWIPISAHGGVTFYHGNNTGANGTFSPLGVSSDKQLYHLDALAQARAAKGPDTGWSGTSDYFMERGLEWWKSAPGDALGLAFTKLRYLLSGRNYGDVYLSTLEREQSFGGFLHLGFLPVPVLVPLALMSLLLLLLRDPRRHVPDMLALGAACAVCVVFWYTPRYRLPAVGGMALLAAWGLAQIGRWRTAPVSAGLCGLALIGGLSSGMLNHWTGFDETQPLRPWFELNLGRAHRKLGEFEVAQEHLREAASLGQREAEIELADMARELGDFEGALLELARLADEQPNTPYAQRSFAVALAQAGRPEEAIPFFERAALLGSDDWLSHYGLGQACLQAGRSEPALVALRRAAELVPDNAGVAYALAVARAQTGNAGRAMEDLRVLLSVNPEQDQARNLLVQLLRGQADDVGAAAVLRAGLERTPGHPGMTFILAWLLSTSRQEEARDGAEAVRLASALCELGAFQIPDHLDVLAAALAEAGRFDEARVRVQEALGLLPSNADPELRRAMQARLEAFQAGRTYRE
ncbi:MAG: tetratricopeptide (TPR) repeat protein [Planctomycetota bacterium]|jgi:tetratricopeptide (TPR) repeat protein